MRWIENCMLSEGKISPDDLDIIRTADTPEKVAQIIVDANRVREGDGRS
jgi:predicted Rossmann-fold nucleotide-binding protein